METTILYWGYTVGIIGLGLVVGVQGLGAKHEFCATWCAE